MKVKKLIEKLQLLDQDADVCIQEGTMTAKKLQFINPMPAYLHPEIGVYFFTNKSRKEYKIIIVLD